MAVPGLWLGWDMFVLVCSMKWLVSESPSNRVAAGPRPDKHWGHGKKSNKNIDLVVVVIIITIIIIIVFIFIIIIVRQKASIQHCYQSRKCYK